MRSEGSYQIRGAGGWLREADHINLVSHYGAVHTPHGTVSIYSHTIPGMHQAIRMEMVVDGRGSSPRRTVRRPMLRSRWPASAGGGCKRNPCNPLV